MARLLNFPTRNFFYCKIEANMKIRVRSQNFREQQGEYFTAHLPQTWMFQAGSQQHFFSNHKKQNANGEPLFIYLCTQLANTATSINVKIQFRPLSIFAECLSWFPAASTQAKSSTPISPPLAEAVSCKTTPLWPRVDSGGWVAKKIEK